MEQKNIEARVILLIIEKLMVDPDTVTMDANLKDDLYADSLDVLELIMELEHEFNISIPDDSVENIDTVKEVITLVEERVSGKK